MIKPSSRKPQPGSTVRSRRAYFDCRYGQLHVRTAFPTTGGFDEQVTLFCLHPAGMSGRVFGSLLALAAVQRSVYAPDLPGCGESDPAPTTAPADAAAAVADLAADLRLRQLDLLGLHSGAAVAVEMALTRPGVVRAIILVGEAPPARLDLLARQERAPQVHVIDAAGFPLDQADDTAPALLARVDGFLGHLPAVSIL